MTLPEILLASKWAVQIDSEAEAQTLQELFPSDRFYKKPLLNIAKMALLDYDEPVALSPCGEHSSYQGHLWRYARVKFYKEEGFYPIYTLSQLEKLIRP